MFSFTKYTAVYTALLCGICTAFVSCGGSKRISSVQSDVLFELEYGNFDNQINMFDVSRVGSIDTSIAMRDGFFYIANSESKKIMELNSYGDLLTIYYNEDFNPVPSFSKGTDGTSATRKAVSYPFNNIKAVSVDSRKYLYAVDVLPQERHEYDEEKKMSLAQVVLRFDASGKFLDYIGQQGPGGTPFPFIKNIYTTNASELVVVCTTGDGFQVYWFSTDGYLMYAVPVKKENVPNPFKDEKNDTFFSVENIVPDYNERKLYLKADYFESYTDEASRVQSGIDYKCTLVHPLSVETGEYEKSVAIPAYSEEIAQGFSKVEYEIPYDFLGVTENNWMFFIVNAEDGMNVQMVQVDGQRILKRQIPVSRTDNLYYTFSLSNTGIISALLVQKDSAKVGWWRTDSLIQSVINN